MIQAFSDVLRSRVIKAAVDQQMIVGGQPADGSTSPIMRKRLMNILH